MKRVLFLFALSLVFFSCTENPFDEKGAEDVYTIRFDSLSVVNIDSVTLWSTSCGEGSPSPNMFGGETNYSCDLEEKFCTVRHEALDQECISLVLYFWPEGRDQLVAAPIATISGELTNKDKDLNTLQLTIDTVLFDLAFEAQNMCDLGDGNCIEDKRDGKRYRTVTIGEQTWMAQNLNYEFEPGSGSVCYGNDEGNCALYGRLYSWVSAMDHTEGEKATGVCPSGFHIPSDGEWAELEVYLGMDSSVVDDFNFRGTTQADSLVSVERFANPYAPFDSVPGFNAIGAGFFEWIPDGSVTRFDRLNDDASFWTSTYAKLEEGVGHMAFKRKMGLNSGQIHRAESWATNYFSVRCVK